VLGELLLGARVFALLEQVSGLVALAPRVGERERAILAVPVSAYALEPTKLVFRSRAAREA
jgi:hypothetical protein